MNTISVSADPATWVRFGITVVRFGTTAVGFGMTVVSGPLLLPLCFCDMAALPTDAMPLELMFDEITPGVVISSSEEFYDAGYELKS